MCNINLVLTKNEPNKKTNLYMEVASWNSWKSNPHGEGYISITNNAMDFTDKRSLGKLSYIDNEPSNVLISHQRYTTSGLGLNNTHPHASKDFILMHNGVFSGVGDDDKSDTGVYLDELQSNMDKTKDVLKAIRLTNKSFGGSYSIVLYEKGTGVLYYYKNAMPSMYVLESDDYLFMSTLKWNLEVAQEMFGIKESISDVEHNRIFSITSGGLIQLGKFKCKKAVYKTPKNSWYYDDRYSYNWDDSVNKSNRATYKDDWREDDSKYYSEIKKEVYEMLKEDGTR